jgi:hypothetical protein
MAMRRESPLAAPLGFHRINQLNTFILNDDERDICWNFLIGSIDDGVISVVVL